MSKQIFYYIIVNKENGNPLIDDGRLSVFTSRYWAVDKSKRYTGFIVTRVPIKDFEKLILKSHPLT